MQHVCFKFLIDPLVVAVNVLLLYQFVILLFIIYTFFSLTVKVPTIHGKMIKLLYSYCVSRCVNILILFEHQNICYLHLNLSSTDRFYINPI